MNYYSIETSAVTSATTATEADALQLKTGAAASAFVTRLGVGSAGSAQDNQLMAKLWRMTVASTAGGAFVPKPRDNTAPAAVSAAATVPTIGTKETNASLILPINARAFAQWVALNQDEWLRLVANAGANGNVDLLDEQAAGVAVTIRYSLTFAE